MRMQGYPISFDPRSKLLVILFASLALIFPLPPILEVSFIGLFSGCFLVSGEWKKGVFFLGVFGSFLFVDAMLVAWIDHPLGVIVDFLIVGNRRLLPTIMAATFAMSGTKIGEWLAALQKLRTPSYLLIPLAVLFRFFPMALQEIVHIRKAMKFRGIATTWQGLLGRPFQSMEYLLVPLLLSAEETSMNLSATALVRGLSNPQKHTSVYQLKLKLPDYFLMSSLVICFGLRMWIK